MCNNAEEHISNIIAGCSILAPSEYTYRHNQLASASKYYEHVSEKVVNTQNTIIMWDFPVTIGRAILDNRPDIIYPHKQNRTTLIQDEFKIRWKDHDKLNKYKNLRLVVSGVRRLK